MEGFPDLPSIDKIKREHGHLKKEFAILDEELDDAIASYELLHPSSKEDDGEGDKSKSESIRSCLIYLFACCRIIKHLPSAVFGIGIQYFMKTNPLP